MKTFARIESGVVVEVLTVNELPDFHPSLVWIECSPSVKEGDLYDGVDFSSPPPLPPLSARERRALRYAVELSNGNPTPTEALADNQSAIITEVAELRQTLIDLVTEIRSEGLMIHPNSAGAMTPNLAERIEKIAVIQAEEV